MAGKGGKTLRRRLWKALLYLVILLALAAGGLYMLEWKPPPLMSTPLRGQAAVQDAPAELELLSWNIGYAGLDREADFFMDGGRGVHPPSRQRVEENLAAIIEVIRGQGADLVLLQEVDRSARRTFDIDQVEALAAILPGYQCTWAPNFMTWVPVPLTRPLGRVRSGLFSASRHKVLSAARIQLPGQHPWPVRVFHLKRCLHELRLPAPGGREWVIINLHLSAFDRGGKLRREQLRELTERMAEHAAAGRYVIAGGDFNQAPPGLPDFGPSGEPEWFQRLPEGWLPEGFRLAFDTSVPSLRATDAPYRPGETFVTVVDGFVVGPGVEVQEVKTLPLDFANSDHHPVLLRVRLVAGDIPTTP